MNTLSFLNLSEFILESGREINSYGLDILTENVAPNIKKTCMIKKINKEYIPMQYMDDSMNIWNTYADRIPELENFFSKIYVSKKFLDLPAVTIPVMDVNEIKAIKPQYLKQYVDNIASILEATINNTTTDKRVDEKIAKLLSDQTLSSIKKNMVRSKTPDYVKDKDFIRFDNRVVVEANTAYIQTTLLPFLRSSDQEKEIMINTIDQVKETITYCTDTMNTYILTITRLMNEKKIEDGNKIYKVLFSSISTYLEASKYLIACVLRKEYIYTTVIKEYITLKDQILEYYPEGESVLHESVLDGSYDFADEDIVINMINGRSDVTDSVIDKLYRTYKDHILQLEGTKLGDDFHSLIDVEITNSPFDFQLFKSLFAMQSSLMESVQLLSQQSKDPDLSIDEITNSSRLDTSILVKNRSLIGRIIDIDIYTSAGLSEKDFCIAFLKELSYAKTFFNKFSHNMKGIFDVFKGLKKDIINNYNDVYSNHERNIEEIQFIDSFEKDFRLLILQIGKSYLHRLSMLEDLVKNNEEKEEGSKVVFDNDESDFIESAMEENIEIEKAFIEMQSMDIFESAYFDIMYKKVTAEPIVFVEAEQQNDANQNNTTDTQNNTNQNTNNQNDKKSNTKPTVTDNSNGQNDTNQNTTNNGDNKSGNKEEFIKSLIQRIKDFGNNIIEKIKGAQKKLKGNLDWINANEEALLSRSYSNVSVNILPYNTNIKYVEVIGDCTNALNNITRNVGRIGKWDNKTINNTMFSKLKLPPDVSKPISERLILALKAKGGKELQTVTVSNGELKSMVPQMIEFLKYYYTGFEKDIESAINNLNNALNGVESRANTLNVEGADNTLKIMGTNINTLNAAIAEVARDRSNDYLTVLKELAPKNTQNTKNSGDKESQQPTE